MRRLNSLEKKYKERNLRASNSEFSETKDEMADVFDFELHEAHTEGGNFDEDSDDVILDDVSYLQVKKKHYSLFTFPSSSI